MRASAEKIHTLQNTHDTQNSLSPKTQSLQNTHATQNSIPLTRLILTEKYVIPKTCSRTFYRFAQMQRCFLMIKKISCQGWKKADVLHFTENLTTKKAFK